MCLSLLPARKRESSGVSRFGVTGLGSPAKASLLRPFSQMSSGMSQLIGLKEKGLPHIAKLLQSGNSDVVRSGASLLSNMSRHPALHRVMGECRVAQASPHPHPLERDPHFPEPTERLPSDRSRGGGGELARERLGHGKGQVTRGWGAGVRGPIRSQAPSWSPVGALGHLTPCRPLLSLPGNQVFPEVTRLLSSHTGHTSNSEDILSSTCYTVRNLMASLPGMAKQHFSSDMVCNVINLCRSRWAARGPLRALPGPAEEQCCSLGRPCGAGWGSRAVHGGAAGRLTRREVQKLSSCIQASGSTLPGQGTQRH